MGKLRSWTTSGDYRITRVLGGRSKVFLVSNGKQNLLVDTGIRSCRKLLEKRLVKLGADQIKYLVLTHSHFDHAGNARWLREKYHAKVIVDRNEVPSLEKGQGAPPPGTLWFSKLIVKYLAPVFTFMLKSDPCPCDLLADDAGFSSEEMKVMLFHTPGHTSGSMSVIVDDEIALVGDTMFGVFPRSIFPPFAHDVPLLVQSWGRLLETGCRLFLPSHGSAISREGAERNYLRKVKR